MVGGLKAATVALVLCAVMLAGCSGDDTGARVAPRGTPSPGKSVDGVPEAEPSPGATEAVTLGTAIPDDDSVVVQWNVPTGDANTVSWVEYGPAGTLTLQSLRQVGPGSHQASLTGLRPGTAYSYRILILSGDDSIRSSVQAFATAAPSSPDSVPVPMDPGALRILAANVPQVRTTSADITWTLAGGTGTVSSVVEYGTDSGFGLRTDANFGTGDFVATLPTLTPGTVYFYRIFARDSSGTLEGIPQTFVTPLSELSVGGTAPPLASPSLVALGSDDESPVITAVSHTAPVATKLGFYWTVEDNADPETSSWIEYGLTPDLGLTGAYQIGLGTRFAFLQGLQPDTTYHFRVAARDIAGNVGVGPIMTFKTPNPAGPACPAPVIAPFSVVTASTTTTTALFRWGVTTCPFLAVISRIEYHAAGEPPFSRSSKSLTGVRSAATTPPDHHMTVLDLKPGTTYTAHVFALDSGGETAESGAVTFTTLAAPKIVNVVVDQSTVLLDRFTIHWTAIGPIDSETWVQYGTGTVLTEKTTTFALRTPTPDPKMFQCTCQITLRNLTSEMEYNFGVFVTGSHGTFATTPPSIKQATAKLLVVRMHNETFSDPPSPDVKTYYVLGQDEFGIYKNPFFTLYSNKPHIFNVTNLMDITARWELWSDDDCDPATPVGAQYGSRLVQTDLLTPWDTPGGNKIQVPRTPLSGPHTSVTLGPGEYCMIAKDPADRELARARVIV